MRYVIYRALVDYTLAVDSALYELALMGRSEHASVDEAQREVLRATAAAVAVKGSALRDALGEERVDG